MLGEYPWVRSKKGRQEGPNGKKLRIASSQNPGRNWGLLFDNPLVTECCPHHVS